MPNLEDSYTTKLFDRVHAAITKLETRLDTTNRRIGNLRAPQLPEPPPHLTPAPPYEQRTRCSYLPHSQLPYPPERYSRGKIHRAGDPPYWLHDFESNDGEQHRRARQPWREPPPPRFSDGPDPPQIPNGGIGGAFMINPNLEPLITIGIKGGGTIAETDVKARVLKSIRGDTTSLKTVAPSSSISPRVGIHPAIAASGPPTQDISNGSRFTTRRKCCTHSLPTSHRSATDRWVTAQCRCLLLPRHDLAPRTGLNSPASLVIRGSSMVFPIVPVSRFVRLAQPN